MRHIQFTLNQCQAFFMVEQDDIDAKLLDYKQKYYPKEIEYLMKAAFIYCSDRINIKLKCNVSQLNFPSDYIEHFYIINGENDVLKIQLNLLSIDLFINPYKHNKIKKYEQLNSPQVQNKDVFEKLDQQLNNLEKNTKKCQQIKKENLIQSIKQYAQSLLTYHDIKVFEMIAKIPKYDDFQLIEFEKNYFLLGSNIKNQNFYLKTEKFKTLKELENISRKYDQCYTIVNHMFVHIENHEQIIIDNDFYLLIQDKVLPKIHVLQTDKAKRFNIS